jgi:hypothetical protein
MYVTYDISTKIIPMTRNGFDDESKHFSGFSQKKIVQLRNAVILA